MSKSDILDLSSSELSELLHQMATSDSAIQRGKANMQRWQRFVNRLYTDPHAISMVQDRSINIAVSDESKRWKLFLHDYGLKDFSEIGGIGGETIRAESAVSESIGREAVDPTSAALIASGQAISGSAGAVTANLASRKIAGSLINSNGDLIGTVLVKTTKAKSNSKGESTVRLTVQVVDLNGKKKTVNVKDVPVAQAAVDAFNVPGWGVAHIMFGLNDSFLIGTIGEGLLFADEIGGELPAGKSVVSVDFSGGFGGLQNVQTVLLPYSEEFSSGSRGKWSFARAAKVKVAKGSSGSGLIDVDTSGGKTNISGIKLSYTPKTGRFKGSFKLYMLDRQSARARLTTKTVKISGFVAGGVGSGIATITGMGIEWPVTVTR